MRILSLVLLGLVLNGCSVSRQTVTNQPPILDRGLSAFAKESGALKVINMSLFLWPIQAEEQAIATISTVAKTSYQIDELAKQLVSLQRQAAQLKSDFDTAECLQKWADLGPDEDPLLVEWVNQWKEGTPADCKSNQDRRKIIANKVDQIGSKEQPILIEKVFKAIDPGYPSVIENQIVVDPKSVDFKIDGLRVDITIGGLFGKGLTYSSLAEKRSGPNTEISGAGYDPRRKLMQFQWARSNADAPGKVETWVAILERNPDFLGAVRFSGEVRVYHSKTLVRTGMIKIEGTWK